MALTIETMSIPYATSNFLSAVAAANEVESPDLTSASSASKSIPPSAAAPAGAAAAMATTENTTTASFTTPERLAGLAAVTPSTSTGTPAATSSSNEEGGSASSEENQYHPQLKSVVEEAVVSASSAEESAANVESSSAPAARTHAVAVAPVAAYNYPQEVSSAHRAAAEAFAAKSKISRKAPSIHLGPRVTPAIRKSPLQPHPQTAMKRKASAALSAHATPVKPRNLNVAIKTGDTTTSQYAAGAACASVASASGQAMKQEECPFTPAVQNNHIPAPSSFFAAQISPLRSSLRRNGEKSNSKGAPILREKTPPLAAASSDLDPSKLSPGMFLSPRTPNHMALDMKAGTKTSGLTPRFTPGMTPTNFASDFGKGHKKEGSLGALDASGVFAWLHSPTANGLFTPSGGLHSLSVTNTPRGMYGFTLPANASGMGPPQLAPSPSRMHASLTASASSAAHPFFAELESGGDLGVNTPQIPESQRSMICISPLASKKAGKNKPMEGAPETPMSINFSEVFASPRLPTPMLSSRAAKKDSGLSSSDGPLSPVTSALHTAERDINLDDDLNALLQLAETTTPGGRHMTFMSPLLTNSLLRVTNVHTEVGGGNDEPPSSLQLPIICGSSVNDGGSMRNKMRRNGLGSRSAISPPQLAIRSTSSGSALDGVGSTALSPLKKKSKKRKAPTSSSGLPGHQYQPQGYHQPSLRQYSHPHAPHSAEGHQGYYHNPPGYHSGSHHGHVQYPGYPAPQQHYAYSEQQQPAASTVSASHEKISPPKSARKSKSGKSRSKSSKTKSASKTPTKSQVNRPITPSSTGTTKRVRKSSSKAAGNASASKKSKTPAVSDPNEKERISAAIYAVNAVYGNGTEKDRKLAEATLRGVTMRPSKKWQAQLYYAGKSRYIGVFDSKEKASLAYEIAREVLKTDKDEPGPANAEETDMNVCLARKAAFAGVSEHASR